MNVGDYVRIRWGNGLQTISKCKNIVDMGDTQYAKDDFYIHTDHSGEVIYKTMIVKSSPNLIDILQAGDYVNGERVINIIKKHKYLEVSDEEIIIDEKDIKTIVTKEMFEQMEYKIQ